MVKEKKQEIEILQRGDPILRQISSAVPSNKIKSPEIRKIILAMKMSVERQLDAAAIAAVQIGKPIRLFVISKNVFGKDPKNSNETKVKDHLVFINPKILKSSKTKKLLEEGCLSVKYVYGKVLRMEKLTVEAYDENGKKFTRGFSGLLAQIVQHEADHLNGILFADKAVDLQEISIEEYEKMLKTL